MNTHIISLNQFMEFLRVLQEARQSFGLEMHTLDCCSIFRKKNIQKSSFGGGACRGPVAHGQTNFPGEAINSASSKPDHRTWLLKKHLSVAGICRKRVTCRPSCQKRPPATQSLSAILLNAKMRELTLNSEQGENMDNVSATLLLVKGKEIQV